MYRIREDEMREKYTLLVPAMLDMHFPVLKWAFYSREYRPVILDNEAGVTDVGLHYVNNDMCYPSILNIGQMVDALQSGRYDPYRTKLLMPTAGDACRGSNYSGALRRAVEKAGFGMVKVVSLNVKGLEKEEMMKVTPGMVWRALFGLFYGDMLMLLVNQVRPYEVTPGSANQFWQQWVDRLSHDLKEGRHLTLGRMKRNFRRMAQDFAALPVTGAKKERCGIVGELYIKYCHMGNWDTVRQIEEEGLESHTNGLSWYVLYYMDSHLAETKGILGPLYRIGIRFLSSLQNAMIAALREYNFYTLEPFAILKQEAEGYINREDTVGDGWLIGAEAVGHILHGCPKVAAVQPFGCMPNQICGRGLYPSLQRKLPQGHIVSIDVDSGASKLNASNRLKMLLQM